MKTRLKLRSILADQQGATAIIVGLMLFVLVGFLALAVDAGYVWVAQNELQNAADAGALAGARFLINPLDGTINTNANQIAYDAATSNDSTNIPVEVNWSGGNSGDIQRGHWSLATSTFTPNANTTQTDLWQGDAALDADVNYINAVRVVTRRQTQPVNLFIAGILGHDSMQVVTDAVAWLGPPGNVIRGFDMPIALCEASIAEGCAVGRMINSGDNLDTYQTGGWTNFIQPCDGGGTNAQEVAGLVNDGCRGEQLLGDLKVNVDMETQGGQIQSAFTRVYNCWEGATNRTQPWALTLPVLECMNHRNITTCEKYRGAIEVEVVWITGPGEDPEYTDAPVSMTGGTTAAGDWGAAEYGAGATGADRWQSFIQHFGLLNSDGNPASYDKKTIYFVPSCTPKEAIGDSGGGYYGKMAKYPKLVE